MKNIINSVFVIIVTLLSLPTFFNSCKQEDTYSKATIETSQITSITEASAKCGGTIISDGGSEITARGVCWSTSPSPTIDNDTTIVASNNSAFTCFIKELTPGTTYYLRAYAINKGGASYGLQMIFTTLSGVIELTTDVVSTITPISATGGGSKTSDGGVTIVASGVCWNTSQNPTTSNSKTIDGSRLGSFSSKITGLTPRTTYYVRSYATNAVGTFYGNEVSFTSLETSGTFTDIEGNVYNYITFGTQRWMTENLKTTKYNDGTSIPLVNDDLTWRNLSTPGYCFFNNDVSNKNTYGLLYNWYTVNTGKLAPSGWHVPTNNEWSMFEDFLIANGYNFDSTTSGNMIAKSLASTSDWVFSTYFGTIGNDLTKNNTSGFSALPVSYRNGSNGVFNSFGYYAYWWSSTEYSMDLGTFRYLGYSFSDLGSFSNSKKHGITIRCVR